MSDDLTSILVLTCKKLAVEEVGICNPSLQTVRRDVETGKLSGCPRDHGSASLKQAVQQKQGERSCLNRAESENRLPKVVP